MTQTIEQLQAKVGELEEKLLAWFEQNTGYLNLRLESFGSPKHSDCIRIPELDCEITLPEGGQDENQ